MKASFLSAIHFKHFTTLFQVLLLMLAVGIEHALGWPIITTAIFATLVWSQVTAVQVYASLVWGWYLASIYGINPGLSMSIFLAGSFGFTYFSRWQQHHPSRFMVIYSMVVALFMVATTTVITSLAVNYASVSLIAVAWLVLRRRGTNTQLQIIKKLTNRT